MSKTVRLTIPLKYAVAFTVAPVAETPVRLAPTGPAPSVTCTPCVTPKVPGIADHVAVAVLAAVNVTLTTWLAIVAFPFAWDAIGVCSS
jgi:hypothetical protein